MSPDIILEVENLSVHFPVPGRRPWSRDVIMAVDDLSFKIERGRTLGLVGESGCGKSTAGCSVLQLIRPVSGRVMFNGVDLCALDRKEIQRARRRLQIVFQDSHASLNPRMPVGELIGEALDIHGLHVGPDRADRLRQLLDMVGLASNLTERYPHELSGGQAQRVAICRALAVEPELIVCDEPVSALDVSVQAQIINLLQDLQSNLGLTYLFISHDLNIVRHMSDTVAVMYLGRIVEFADTETIHRSAAHPYTKALMSAAPVPDPDAYLNRTILSGELPDPANPPSGCRFRTRCPIAAPACAGIDPPARMLGENHWASCIRIE